MNALSNQSNHDSPDGLNGLQNLAAALGMPNEYAVLANEGTTWITKPITNVGELEYFLERYLGTILKPIELPAMSKAYWHTHRGELKELVALDAELSRSVDFAPFSRASAAIGGMQLRRLRPLRGHRTVARYVEAVSHGEAQGWHVTVYGMLLAAFSMPLRPGLIQFGERTHVGFLEAGASRISLAPIVREALEIKAREQVISAVGELLANSSFGIV